MAAALSAEGRSSGKVILCGEHAVVYGVPALACGIERGVLARATGSATQQLLIDGQSIDPGNDTHRAFGSLLTHLDAPPCRVEVTLEMPAGVGLGASAAIGVAVARAVLALGSSPAEPRRESPADLQRLLEAAHVWERVFHGNPSGIDAACAASGGCLRYVAQRGFEAVPLNCDLELVVGVAGPPSSTKEMVARVAGFRDRNRGQFEHALTAIGELVETAQACLGRGDREGLGTTFDQNQDLLANWRLSTPAIDRCCQLARAAGAAGAKLTGAGGGGCVIAVPGAQGTRLIEEAWTRAGFPCFVSRVGARRT